MKRVSLSIALAAVFTANSASAHGAYVVIKDDGTLNGKLTVSEQGLASKIITAYKAAGETTLPDVISLWTNFSMDGNDVETLFDPVSNDVTGIGLESQYGGDGTIQSSFAPLRSILLHNNVMALSTRAADQGAPIQNFAQYIYLLEFSHNWGPAIQLPAEADASADAGSNPGELIGFPFHWSFFFDPGGMAGGNPWQDLGGGSFSVSGQTPSTIKYSPIDLYIMGLADKTEVPPFGVIENAVVPGDVKDPFSRGLYDASSFPWWGSTAFTVTGANRREITIDDVIAANGPRVPDASTSPKNFNIGIVLDVAADATDDDIAAAEAALDPIAITYPQAFHDATGGKGTFTIATSNQATDDDAGVIDDGGAVAPNGAAPSSSGSSGGCNVTASSPDRTGWFFFASGLVACAAGLIRRRK